MKNTKKFIALMAVAVVAVGFVSLMGGHIDPDGGIFLTLLGM